MDAVHREVILDTETTGLNPSRGDKVVEIGCIMLEDGVPNGNTYHQYINPERDMPEEAFRIHGLSSTFLADFPPFKDIADDFLAFTAGTRLVIHNADFDMGFLNAELQQAGYPPLDTHEVVDTVRLARQKFPGARVNLDALCQHYGIDNSRRTLHGALKDADLLMQVYIELTGGRQRGLSFMQAQGDNALSSPANTDPMLLSLPATETACLEKARLFAPTPEEDAAHRAFIATLPDALWIQHYPDTPGTK